jgi:hypothetical protein
MDSQDADAHRTRVVEEDRTKAVPLDSDAYLPQASTVDQLLNLATTLLPAPETGDGLRQRRAAMLDQAI